MAQQRGYRRHPTRLPTRPAAGIHTYPTLIYERDGVQQVVVQGYMAPDAAVERIKLMRQYDAVEALR
ncbi:MAG: hypothetical protein HC893_02430 [Chloroflexaceae bacterium]|nr:hypothetical protein [Chloroflexaceae bacterium]